MKLVGSPYVRKGMNAEEIRSCVDQLPDGEVIRCRFEHGQYGPCNEVAEVAIKPEVFSKLRWPRSRDIVLHGRAMCMVHARVLLNNYFPGKL